MLQTRSYFKGVHMGITEALTIGDLIFAGIAVAAWLFVIAWAVSELSYSRKVKLINKKNRKDGNKTWLT